MKNKGAAFNPNGAGEEERNPCSYILHLPLEQSHTSGWCEAIQMCSLADVGPLRCIYHLCCRMTSYSMTSTLASAPAMRPEEEVIDLTFQRLFNSNLFIVHLKIPFSSVKIKASFPMVRLQRPGKGADLPPSNQPLRDFMWSPLRQFPAVECDVTADATSRLAPCNPSVTRGPFTVTPRPEDNPSHYGSTLAGGAFALGELESENGGRCKL